MAVEVGDEAPDFTLTSASGEEVRLSDLRGVLRALLLFYPKDMTKGWTDQLVAVRDNIEGFREVDTEPFGVNPGSAESHRQFIAEHSFPFELLVDNGMDVARQYGAVREDGSGIARTVVIVGKDGKVIYKQAGAPSPILLINAINAANDTSS